MLKKDLDKLENPELRRLIWNPVDGYNRRLTSLEKTLYDEVMNWCALASRVDRDRRQWRAIAWLLLGLLTLTIALALSPSGCRMPSVPSATRTSAKPAP